MLDVLSYLTAAQWDQIIIGLLAVGSGFSAYLKARQAKKGIDVVHDNQAAAASKVVAVKDALEHTNGSTGDALDTLAKVVLSNTELLRQMANAVATNGIAHAVQPEIQQVKQDVEQAVNKLKGT